MMTVGGFLARLQPAGLPAQDAHEFLVDDLDDLLARVQRGGDLFAQGAFLDLGREGADHGDGDVGVQQGTADLADCGVDVGLGQPSLAAQVLEGGCQAVGE